MKILQVILGGLLAIFGGIGALLSTLCFSSVVFIIGAVAHATMVGISGAGVLTIVWTAIYTIALILIGGVIGLAISAFVGFLGAFIVEEA